MQNNNNDYDNISNNSSFPFGVKISTLIDFNKDSCSELHHLSLHVTPNEYPCNAHWCNERIQIYFISNDQKDQFFNIFYFDFIYLCFFISNLSALNNILHR